MKEVKFSELPIGSIFKLNTYTWRKEANNVVKGILIDRDYNATIIGTSSTSSQEKCQSIGQRAYIGPNRKVKQLKNYYANKN